MNSLETYKMYVENFEVTFMNGNKRAEMEEIVEKYNKIIEEITKEITVFCQSKQSKFKEEEVQEKKKQKGFNELNCQEMVELGDKVADENRKGLTRIRGDLIPSNEMINGINQELLRQ